MAEVSVSAAWRSRSATFWLVGLRLYMKGRFSGIAPGREPGIPARINGEVRHPSFHPA